jgi:hypothetical protein
MDVVETKKEKTGHKASSGGETDCCICEYLPRMSIEGDEETRTNSG